MSRAVGVPEGRRAVVASGATEEADVRNDDHENICKRRADACTEVIALRRIA